MIHRFILVSLAALLLAGCGEKYLAEREYWKAERVLRNIKKASFEAEGPKVLDPAIEAFENVYELYPGSPKAVESLFVITNLHIKQGKYDGAIVALKKVIQNHSDVPERAAEARYGMAEIYELQGDWKQAEQLYWEMAEYHPFHRKGLYAPIHILIHFKKVNDPEGLKRAYAKAMDHYEKFTKETDQIQLSAVVKHSTGLAHLAYGEWEKAREVWENISKESPDSPFAPMALLAAGELSWRKNEFDRSIDAYQKFLTLYPKSPLLQTAHTQLGLIYEAKADYPKSREWLEKAAAEAKTPEEVAQLRLLIARTLQKEGKWPEAQKAFEDLQMKYPDTNAALQIPLLIATHYNTSGDKEKAKDVLDKAIGQYQTMMGGTDAEKAAFAERLQNAALFQKGDWKEVLDNFDRQITREKLPVRKGNWYFLKALVTENRLQDEKQAALLYKNFLALFPEHPLANLARARRQSLLAAKP